MIHPWRYLCHALQARPWAPTDEERNLYGGFRPWGAYRPCTSPDVDKDPCRRPLGKICAVCMNCYKLLGVSIGLLPLTLLACALRALGHCTMCKSRGVPDMDFTC